MIESLALEKRQIEFIGDQPGCDVRSELRIAFHWRKPGPSFVRHGIRVANPQGEVGIMFKEKRRAYLNRNRKSA
jgi:hypothetical protein